MIQTGEVVLWPLRMCTCLRNLFSAVRVDTSPSVIAVTSVRLLFFWRRQRSVVDPRFRSTAKIVCGSIEKISYIKCSNNARNIILDCSRVMCCVNGTVSCCNFRCAFLFWRCIFRNVLKKVLYRFYNGSYGNFVCFFLYVVLFVKKVCSGRTYDRISVQPIISPHCIIYWPSCWCYVQLKHIFVRQN